jgi:hypothetical protein
MQKFYCAAVWVLGMFTLCAPSSANAQCSDEQLPQDKFVFAENPQGPAPHSTNFIVNHHEEGIMYTLRRDADNSIVAGPQSGAIGLFVQGVTETTVYNVLARNPVTGCERQMSTKPVITIISTECSPPADRQVVVEDDTGNAPHATNIIVEDPQPGILYSLRLNSDNTVIDGPQQGAEPLFTGEINQTTQYNVLALDSETQCETVLSTRPVVTIVSSPQPTLLYPDLFSWAKPGTYMHDVQIDKRQGRRLLRFSTASTNKGAGPFELHAVVGSDGSTTATQWIYDDQGGHIERHAGTFVFAGHEDHNHFHFADYANYRLRSVLANNGLGPVVATSDKISFAMFDVTAYDLSLPGAPAVRVYQRPESTLDRQGISVGWADVYGRSLDGQWIDLAGIPDGQYWLEITIDPRELIAESDETNNTTHVKVILKGNRANTNSDQPSGGTSLLAARSAPVSPVPESETEAEATIYPYPNPSKGEFYVAIEDEYTGLYFVQIRDFSGNTLQRQTIVKEGKMATTHIALKQAREGIYVLSVFGNGKVTNTKIVIVD